MSILESRSFDEPDEVTTLPYMSSRVVLLGDVHLALVVHEPGWRWSEHVRPVVGTDWCLHHHQGFLLSGALEVWTESGARRVVRAHQAYDIGPGHDAAVIGDEPAVGLEFTGARGWAKSPEATERFTAALLVTDLVDSTSTAARLGDAAWKDLLAHHGERVHRELERFRGIPVAHTGDGYIATFDGASRAIRCALAIRNAAHADELRVRAGVHAGEVERAGANVRGVAVHAAARIAALAGADEVLVSAAAAALAEGSGIVLEDAGEHELKGLPERRRLYRVVVPAAGA